MTGTLFWAFVLSIVYTYLGYPVLLALLARRARPVSNAGSTTPSVTLLIAAYNEQAVIAEKLENSLALDYPREQLQILVAADGSCDATVELVCRFAEHGINLSYSPARRGKMAAINRAMPLARGDIIVFSDANSLYPPDALNELVAPFRDPEVGAVSGAKLIEKGDGALGESEGLYAKYESFIKEQETRLGTTTGVSGEILAIRSDLFESPSDRIINDDFYMAMRIVRRGYRVVYAPKARSFERISASAQDEVVRRSRIIAGRYQAMALAREWLPITQPIVVWQVISHKFLRPLVPLAMAGALVTNAIAVLRPGRRGGVLRNLRPPFGGLVLAAQFAFYLLALIGSRMERTRASGSRLPLYLYLPTFLVNSNIAQVIGLYRFVTGRQTTLWERVRRQPIPARDSSHVG